MPQRPASTYFRLGLFVLVGLGCLVAVLFMLGRKQNLFGDSLEVQADFRNVAGLLTGNNVRLGGISVGTVQDIRILNDSTVRVGLRLNREVQPYVKKNAIASIGTDGLVGNTIINLKAGPTPAPPIESGDMLRTTTPLALDAMLGTLNVSNKNLVGITKDLGEITHKLNSSNAFWNLLSDEQLALEMHRSLRNAAAATALLQGSAADMQQLTRGLRQGRGPVGYLLNDTAFAGHMRHATRQLASTSDTLAYALAGLKLQLKTPNGPLNTLLADTAMSRNLRQSLRNVELGTAGFSQNMDALKHNFLLRGYFRKQARKDKARAAAE
jgi:phospholipid/cholesterol/gamma-HCH transport system substrate-binding protein